MKRDCTIQEVKTKVLIRCAVTAMLTCALIVFAYAKSRFSLVAAHISSASNDYISFRLFLLSKWRLMDKSWLFMSRQKLSTAPNCEKHE